MSDSVERDSKTLSVLGAGTLSLWCSTSTLFPDDLHSDTFVSE